MKMKTIPSFWSFLLFGIMLLSASCEPTFTEKQQHPLNQTHEYPSANALPTGLDSMEKEGIKPHTELRDIWQKPGLVISRLGDLKGKTIADIGAGPYGYFSLRFAGQTDAEKVIAIDIDPDALNFINEAGNTFLSGENRKRLETRLARPDDPLLQAAEADVVLIVNTVIYLNDRVKYFRNLHKGLAKGGRLVIIDYKKKQTPIGPPVENRVSLGRLESELQTAGYQLLPSDDKTLEFQYIITAVNVGE